jgi:hypothetical protein
VYREAERDPLVRLTGAGELPQGGAGEGLPAVLLNLISTPNDPSALDPPARLLRVPSGRAAGAGLQTRISEAFPRDRHQKLELSGHVEGFSGVPGFNGSPRRAADPGRPRLRQVTRKGRSVVRAGTSASSSDYPFARGRQPQQTRLLFPART